MLVSNIFAFLTAQWRKTVSVTFITPDLKLCMLTWGIYLYITKGPQAWNRGSWKWITRHLVIYIAGLPMGPPSKPLSDLTDAQKRMLKGNLNKVASEGRFLDMLDKYEPQVETSSTVTSYVLMATCAYFVYKIICKKINW